MERKRFVENAGAIAKAMGQGIGKTAENFGVYEVQEGPKAGKTILEVSYSFELPGASEAESDLFASLLGDLGFEPQEAVISSNYVATKEEANAIQFAIRVKRKEGIPNLLKEINFSDGATFDETDGIILLNQYDWTDGPAFERKLNELVERLGGNIDEQQGKKYQIDFIASRYLDKERRRDLYQAWLGVHGDRNEDVRVLRDYVQQALEEVSGKAEKGSGSDHSLSARAEEALGRFQSDPSALAGLTVAQERGTGKAALQRTPESEPFFEIAELVHAEAEKAVPEATKVLSEAARKTGLEWAPGNLQKSVGSIADRLYRNVRNGKGADPYLLKDWIRTKFEFDGASAERAKALISSLSPWMGGIEIKDGSKPGGYRGIHLLLSVGGVPLEIQLHTKKSWALKLRTDAIYERWRSVGDLNDPEAGSRYFSEMAESGREWGRMAETPDFQALIASASEWKNETPSSLGSISQPAKEPLTGPQEPSENSSNVREEKSSLINRFDGVTAKSASIGNSSSGQSIAHRGGDSSEKEIVQRTGVDNEKDAGVHELAHRIGKGSAGAAPVVGENGVGVKSGAGKKTNAEAANEAEAGVKGERWINGQGEKLEEGDYPVSLSGVGTRDGNSRISLSKDETASVVGEIERAKKEWQKPQYETVVNNGRKAKALVLKPTVDFALLSRESARNVLREFVKKDFSKDAPTTSDGFPVRMTTASAKKLSLIPESAGKELAIWAKEILPNAHFVGTAEDAKGRRLVYRYYVGVAKVFGVYKTFKINLRAAKGEGHSLYDINRIETIEKSGPGLPAVSRGVPGISPEGGRTSLEGWGAPSGNSIMGEGTVSVKPTREAVNPSGAKTLPNGKDSPYNGSDEERELGKLQEESRGLTEGEQQLFHSGDREIDEALRARLSRAYEDILQARSRVSRDGYGLLAGTGEFRIYADVEPGVFHDIFEINRRYLRNGELVDLHDSYEGVRCYLSSDGMAGFAIEPDGNLVSVFNLGSKRGFLRAISGEVGAKATMLDCYNSPKQPLAEMYAEKFGFKVASLMDYAMEYDHDGIAENHGMPKVAFMVNSPERVAERHFGKDEYDAAKDYQLSFVRGNAGNGAEALPKAADSPYNVSDAEQGFRELQESSRRLSDRDVQGFHEGSKRIDDAQRSLLATSLGRWIDASGNRLWKAERSLVNPKNSGTVDVVEDVDGSLFHDVFEINQKYLINGDAVDVHDPEYYSKTRNFLTKDGLAGFALDGDDLVSVFSNRKEPGFLSSIKPLLEELGARTLDCFDSPRQPLPSIYSKTIGFKPAAIMAFSYGILAEEKGKEYADYFVRTYGEAPVVFMVRSEGPVEAKRFGKDEYDAAKAYQLSLASGGSQGGGSDRKATEKNLQESGSPESRFGSGVKDAPASLVLEAANAKEGKVFSRKGADALPGLVRAAIGKAIEETSGVYGSVDIAEKGDLALSAFLEANLSKGPGAVERLAEKAERALLSSPVTYLEGTYNPSTITLGEIAEANPELAKRIRPTLERVIGEYLEGGKPSRLSAAVSELSGRLDALAKSYAETREMARTVAAIQKKANTLRNKLGKGPDAGPVATVLRNGTAEDVSMVGFFRGLLSGLSVSSRTGLTVSPRKANELASFAKAYDYERYKDAALWDPALKSELDALAEEAGPDGFAPNKPLSLEAHRHVLNILSAAGNKLSEQAMKRRAENVEKAKEATIVLSAVRPYRVPAGAAVRDALEGAMGLPSYLDSHLGAENPARDLIVEGGKKALGLALSAKQRYQAKADAILREEGFRKGLSFLSKKVAFKGEKITRGELASIYFSAKSKPGIAKGENVLTVYDPKSGSASKTFRLSEGDLARIEERFSPEEMRALRRIVSEDMGGEMAKDFKETFERRHGYSPEMREDYFTLRGDSARLDAAASSSAFGANLGLSASMGSERSRVDYKGAYRISDFRSTLSRYAEDLGNYVGLGNWNEDLRALINAKVDLPNGERLSFGDLMGRNMPNWTKTWMPILRDLATGGKAFPEGQGKLLGTLFRGGTAAVLGLNMSSATKQWLSDFLTASRIGAATWLRSKARVPGNLAKAKRIESLLTNEGGLFDTSLPEYAHLEPAFAKFRDRFGNAGLARASLLSNGLTGIQGKIADAVLKPMELTDKWNILINVWSAAEQWAKDELGLAFGTRENQAAAVEKTLALVLETQSNSDPLYVSPLRSGRLGTVRQLVFGLFGADNQNKLQELWRFTADFANAKRRVEGYDAILNNPDADAEAKGFAQAAKGKAERTYSKANLAKGFSTIVAVLLLGGISTAAIDALFDRVKAKGGKTFRDGLTAEDAAQIARDALYESTVGWMPYVGTLANAIANNSDVSLFTADQLNSAIEAVRSAVAAAESGDPLKAGKAARDAAFLLGRILGLPLENVYKYVRGVTRNVSEGAYAYAFRLSDGLSSASLSASYRKSLEENDLSGAVLALSADMALNRVGTLPREALLEIARLERDGESARPKAIPNAIADAETGERIALTDAQKEAFSKEYSRASKAIASLTGNERYKGLSAASRAKAIRKLSDAYYALAKAKATGKEPAERYAALLEVAGGDEQVLAAILLSLELAERMESLQGKPKNARQTRSEAALGIANREGGTKAQRLLRIWLMGVSLSEDSKRLARGELARMGMGKEEAAALLS